MILIANGFIADCTPLFILKQCSVLNRIVCLRSKLGEGRTTVALQGNRSAGAADNGREIALSIPGLDDICHQTQRIYEGSDTARRS